MYRKSLPKRDKGHERKEASESHPRPFLVFSVRNPKIENLLVFRNVKGKKKKKKQKGDEAQKPP